MHMGQLFDEKMKTRLGRVQIHIHQNLDLYVVGAVGLVAGVYLTKKLQKPVDLDLVLNEWLGVQSTNGLTVYGLDATQNAAYNAMYDLAEAEALRHGWSTYQVLEEMIKQFNSQVSVPNCT